MYWSIYDTMVLVTGVLSAAIALIPLPEIPGKTRLIAVLVGGGLIIVSFILGNMPSFTYPSIVFVAPVLALIAGGVVVKTALDERKKQADASRGGHGAALQYGESGHHATSAAAQPAPTPSAASTAAPTTAASERVEPVIPAKQTLPSLADPRGDAWASLFDPSTPPGRLAEIAAAYPEFAPQIANHPNAYADLRAWAAAIAHGGTPS